MRHFIDFRTEGGLVVALTDDGLLLATSKEAPVEGSANVEARWRPWELLPTIPQEGYDADKTIAAIAADARAFSIGQLFTQAMDEFRKLQAELMVGRSTGAAQYATPPGYGGPLCRDVKNPNCALDAGHPGDCQRERPAESAPAPEAPIAEETAAPPEETKPSE